MELTLHSGKLTAVVTTDGGELISLKEESGLEHIWQGDPAVWKGRNPNLFPIVGKLRDGKVYAGDFLCEMPQHGLARQRAFQLGAYGEDFAEFVLAADETTRLQYPFDFLLKVRHTLLANGFETQFTVENRGEQPMPFCIGAHTGFNCPMEPGKTLEDYVLRFSDEEDTATVPFSAGGYPNLGTGKLPLQGREWTLRYEDFDREDTLIFDGLRSKQVTLLPKNGGKGVQMDFSGWPMLAFWTKPHANAPYLCIEPWQGCAAGENEDGTFIGKHHCVTLESGASWQRAFCVALV